MLGTIHLSDKEVREENIYSLLREWKKTQKKLCFPACMWVGHYVSNRLIFLGVISKWLAGKVVGNRVIHMNFKLA